MTNHAATGPHDILCLSHLQWDFVYQRPQHLMTRFAREHRVWYIEEPRFDADSPNLEEQMRGNVHLVVPHMPARWLDLQQEDVAEMVHDRVPDAMSGLLSTLLCEHGIQDYILWYYTPMALRHTRRLQPRATVYDCMDELSAFAGAPGEIKAREVELLQRADLVFTGGHSLYESKRTQHPSVHSFPSSVDINHFARARQDIAEPDDQATVPHPRLGFYGVLDERLDLDLIKQVAAARPDWHLVMIGPVAKIDEASLPRADNIHYLGKKSYDDLPAYLSGWDVALLPFAHNEATRYISPTKTPEYLAAGVPVVSTSIRDVVHPYGEQGLVRIADSAGDWMNAIVAALQTGPAPDVDEHLNDMSWDRTFRAMQNLVRGVLSDGSSQKRHVEHDPDVIVEVRPAEQPLRFDYLVVGAGFAGSVLAERLASQAGKRVLIVDRRPHIGGNAYDHYDDAGLLVHRYGPHIFHTNSTRVFDYLSMFTAWRPYQHRVRAAVDGSLLPMPINLDTVNGLYGTHFTSFELQEFFDSVREPVEHAQTSEDVVVGAVGRDLYEKFFRGYTRKQWGLDPSELDAGVTARVPTRTSKDDRYFTDSHQAMPLHGYTRMFERMLSHPNIKIMLQTDYRDIDGIIPYEEMIYTGPIDEYFDYRYGRLPYRSLEFAFETHDRPQYQPYPVINYPNDYAYTRITEFKYLTGQEHPKTTTVTEYPRADGDPYYPVPRPENAALYARYKSLAERTPHVQFVGRLATYKYYNMDQVVAQALALFDRIQKSERQVNGVARAVESGTVPAALPAGRSPTV